MKNLLPCGIVVWALAGGLVGCRAPADQSASARVPHGLTVEYRENPCGLDAPAPRLGWKLAADGRDVMQAAWRVLAATSRENLAQDVGDLWDSGRVAGDANVGVAYAGKPLATSQRVFWKVKTWTAAGVESPWSAPAEWTMEIGRAHV